MLATTMRAPVMLSLLAALALGACARAPQPSPAPPEPPAREHDKAAEALEEPEPEFEPEPEPEPTEVRDDADLREQAIAAVIRERLPELQGCYEQELRKDHSLAGKMLYTILIAPDGAVSEVRIDEDSVGSEAVRVCVSEMIAAWSFADAGVPEPTEVGFAVRYVGDSSD